MPSMSDIGQMMQDPSIRQLAEQFGAGGQGGAGRGAGSGENGSNNPDMYS